MSEQAIGLTRASNDVRRRRFLVRYGVYLSLLVLLIVTAVITPSIYSRNLLFLILRQASQLGLVAIGQTLVMLVAGLDLSVTGVLVLTSVVIAQVSGGQDGGIAPAVLLALGLRRLNRDRQRAAGDQAERAALCRHARHAGAGQRRHAGVHT